MQGMSLPILIIWPILTHMTWSFLKKAPSQQLPLSPFRFSGRFFHKIYAPKTNMDALKSWPFFGIYVKLPGCIPQVPCHLPPNAPIPWGRRPGEVAEDVVMLAAPAATAAGMTPQEAQEVPKMELFFLAGEERGWLD